MSESGSLKTPEEERQLLAGHLLQGSAKQAVVLILSQAETSNLLPIVAEAGHRIIEAYDSRELLLLAAQGEIDAVILPNDAGLVGEEGLLQVMRRLTAAPIIVVGGESETQIRNSLLHGADAYFPLPVDDGMLRVGLRTLLRGANFPAVRDRASIMTPSPAQAAVDLVVDLASREAWVWGKRVHPALSRKEFDILHLLYRQRGRAFSRDEIAAAGWPERVDGDVGQQEIDQYVRRVRVRIEPDPSRPIFISTVRRFGYKLKWPQPVEVTPHG